MIRITIFLLLLSFGVSAQDFPQKVVGKQQFTDSVQFKKFKNNSAMDSVLITDTSGKLRLKKVSAGWGLTGNASTDADINFIGTTDDVNLVFKRNSFTSGIISTDNTSFGYRASNSAGGGSGNVSFGAGALFSAVSASSNTAIGHNASYNSSGGSNTSLGSFALYANVTGSDNVAIGYGSVNNMEGSENIGIGTDAMSQGTTGSRNVGIGKRALHNTTGTANVGVGSFVGRNITSGSYNTILGDSTGLDITTGSNNTIIGARLYGLSSSLSNNVIIADGDGNIRQRFYGSDSVTIANIVASRTSTRDLMLVQDSTTKKVGYRAIPTGGGGGISGSGTTDYIPKWSSSSALGNSPLFDSSGYIGLNTIHPLAMLHVGSGTVNNSSDAAVLVSRSLTGAGSSHAFADATNFAKNVGTAYNSFDARNTIGGAVNYDHYVGFQSVPIYSSSGTMTNLYGSYFKPVVNSGTITNNYGYYAANMDAISGTVTNNYGLYVEPLTRGGTNYAIYTSGSSLVYLGGAITANSSATVAGQINANSVGGNIRFKADGTTGKDGTILASSGGDLYFSNWDLTKGIKVANSGDINTIGSGSFTSTGAFISAGTLNANSVGTNLRFKADGTTAKDGGFFANSGGDIFLSNWDANRGFKIVSTGEIQTLSSTMNFAGATSSYPSLVVSSGSLLLKDAAGTTSAGLGVGVSSVMDGSAKLQVNATDKGFLPPRMTATQGSAISSPAEGLLIYVTNTNGTFTAKGWWGYDGAAWQKLN